jgi:hypothetical protein
MRSETQTLRFWSETLPRANATEGFAQPTFRFQIPSLAPHNGSFPLNIGTSGLQIATLRSENQTERLRLETLPRKNATEGIAQPAFRFQIPSLAPYNGSFPPKTGTSIFDRPDPELPIEVLH